jgi:hypothetical protein
MLCAIIRKPALAAAKCAKPGLPRRLAEEAAEAADAPEILELRRRQLTEIDPLIIAGIEDHEVSRVVAVARRHGQIEQADHVLLAGRVDRHGFRAAVRFANSLCDLRDLLRRTPADDNVIALEGKAPA